MTSRNNNLTSYRGSALLVTILLISVLLTAALILLQRIVPYAKSVRSVHEASQAYYVARGQADLARYNFLYGGGGTLQTWRIPSLFRLLSETNLSTTITPATKRGNVFLPKDSNDVGDSQLEIDDSAGTGNIITKIRLPFELGARRSGGGDRIVSSTNLELPLKIKLFSTDDTIRKFGTSKANDAYHTLNPRNSGGLRFDLRGVNTVEVGTTGTFTLNVPGTFPPTAILTLKMQYFSGDAIAPIKTFTAEANPAGTEINLKNLSGNTQLINTSGGIDSLSPPDPSFGYFLGQNNCTSATICSLSLLLSGTNTQPIDFQLVSSAQIPDLNAVVIGDGLSGNGLYYQRIIDLIPTPQDI